MTSSNCAPDSNSKSKKLRVAFCGASGTGKTTLSEYIQETYGLPYCPVGSRSVSKAMGFASPYDVDKAGLREQFQKRLLDEKHAWESEHEVFVTDRTPLDNLVYTVMHGGVKVVDEAYLEKVRLGCARYTHVFFCSIYSFLSTANDSARIASRTYHQIYQSVFEGMNRSNAFLPSLVNMTSSQLEWRRERIVRELQMPSQHASRRNVR